MSACLYQLADPARNKEAESRVQALIALSEFYGLATPKSETVMLPHNLLKLIENELVCHMY